MCVTCVCVCVRCMCERVGVHIPVHTHVETTAGCRMSFSIVLCLFTSRCGRSLNGKFSLLARLAGLESKKPGNPSHARVIDMCSHAWFFIQSWGFELWSSFLQNKHSYPLNHLPSSYLPHCEAGKQRARGVGWGGWLCWVSFPYFIFDLLPLISYLSFYSGLELRQHPQPQRGTWALYQIPQGSRMDVRLDQSWWQDRSLA